MKATTLVIASLAAACTWSAHSAIVISPVSISITGADEFFPAVNLINGSGLEVPLNSGDTLPVISNHIYGNGADNSWVSGAFGFPSDWYASSGTIPTFVLDLGKQSLLDTVHLWAYGGGTGVAGTVSGNSARSFEFRFNTEAQGNLNFLGSAVTVTADHGPQSELSGFILPRQDFPVGAQNARYVEMRVTDNWYVAPGDGTTTDEHGHLIRGGDRVGFGEIRFSVVPEPSTCTLLGSAIVLLPAGRFRRRVSASINDKQITQARR